MRKKTRKFLFSLGAVVPAALGAGLVIACGPSKSDILVLESEVDYLRDRMLTLTTTSLSGKDFSDLNYPKGTDFSPTLLGLEGFAIPENVKVTFRKNKDSRIVTYFIDNQSSNSQKYEFNVEFRSSMSDVKILESSADAFEDLNTTSKHSFDFYNLELNDFVINKTNFNNVFGTDFPTDSVLDNEQIILRATKSKGSIAVSFTAEMNSIFRDRAFSSTSFGTTTRDVDLLNEVKNRILALKSTTIPIREFLNNQFTNVELTKANIHAIVGVEIEDLGQKGLVVNASKRRGERIVRYDLSYPFNMSTKVSFDVPFNESATDQASINTTKTLLEGLTKTTLTQNQFEALDLATASDFSQIKAQLGLSSIEVPASLIVLASKPATEVTINFQIRFDVSDPNFNTTTNFTATINDFSAASELATLWNDLDALVTTSVMGDSFLKLAFAETNYDNATIKSTLGIDLGLSALPTGISELKVSKAANSNVVTYKAKLSASPSTTHTLEVPISASDADATRVNMLKTTISQIAMTTKANFYYDLGYSQPLRPTEFAIMTGIDVTNLGDDFRIGFQKSQNSNIVRFWVSMNAFQQVASDQMIITYSSADNAELNLIRAKLYAITESNRLSEVQFNALAFGQSSMIDFNETTLGIPNTSLSITSLKGLVKPDIKIEMSKVANSKEVTYAITKVGDLAPKLVFRVTFTTFYIVPAD